MLRALARLGFVVSRDREHVSLLRANPDGTKTPMTIPSHTTIKGSTLRTMCTRAGIPRDDFLKAFEES